jgi:hypothetical protein
MAKKRFVVGLTHVGHLGIQYGGHVTSSPMAPFDLPDPKT